MHEVLFRGKRISNSKWVEGFMYSQHFPLEFRDDFYIRCYDTDYLVLPETVGQYTGLTDKNGVRIFEGDIIQSLESSVTGLVQWFPEHSAFMVWCKSANEVGFLYECVNIIKVIGNIHDNPEILKGGGDNG